MGANTRDAPVVTGLILARRRRRVGAVDLLVKSNPGDAAPAVYGDLYFDTPAAGGNYVLTALGGAYTVTGGAAVIKRDRNMTASGGSYAVTGSSAIVEKDRRLTASGGSYAVAGGQAVIERDRRLTATGGAYSLAGGAATITTTSTDAYVLTALGGSYAVTGGDASITLTPSQTPRNGGFEMGGPTPRKVYIKRGKKIHIFDTVEDADAWEAAEAAAQEAIAKAKTRTAKRRIVRKVETAIEHEVLRLDLLDALVARFNLKLDLPSIEARQDWSEYVRIAMLARELEDEEEIETLLLVA